MELDQFWSLIRAAQQGCEGESEIFAENLGGALEGLTPDEVRGFRERLNELIDNAYTYDLWGAAYLMNGGCSDDGFEYWRAWLVGQGRGVYEAALKDADTLAGATFAFGDEYDYESESLLYLPLEVYEQMAGEEMDHAGLRTGGGSGAAPAGEPWDEDSDELERRLPKLAKKYSE